MNDLRGIVAPRWAAALFASLAVTLGAVSAGAQAPYDLLTTSIESALVEEGLDAPLRVRHLLDHTGGLDDARADVVAVTDQIGSHPRARSRLQTRHRRQIHPFGGRADDQEGVLENVKAQVRRRGL